MARSAEHSRATRSFDANDGAPSVPCTHSASCNGSDHRAVWIWEGKLAPGEVTILTGAAGKGFVSADIIARVLNGDSFPDEGIRSDGFPSERNPAQPAAGNPASRAPLPVVVVASNRETFDNIARRVEAAGGDTERLQVLPFFAVDDEPQKDEHSPLSASITRGTRSAECGTGEPCATTHRSLITPHQPPDLDYVDHLLALLPEGTLVVVDSVAIRLARRGAELREETLDELRSWAAVARRWRAAVLVITGGLPANPNRAFAALASCGVAASIWALHRDEISLDDRRYLVPLRSARASDATSLVLRIRPAPAQPAAGNSKPGAVARVEWRTPSVKTAEALVLAGAKAMRGGPLGDAKRWLLKRLAEGPVAVNRLKSEVEAGEHEQKPYSWRTVLRAMAELSILSTKVSPGGKAHYEWSLPIEQWQAGQPRPAARESCLEPCDPEQMPLRDTVIEKQMAMSLMEAETASGAALAPR